MSGINTSSLVRCDACVAWLSARCSLMRSAVIKSGFYTENRMSFKHFMNHFLHFIWMVKAAIISLDQKVSALFLSITVAVGAGLNTWIGSASALHLCIQACHAMAMKFRPITRILCVGKQPSIISWSNLNFSTQRLSAVDLLWFRTAKPIECNQRDAMIDSFHFLFLS